MQAALVLTQIDQLRFTPCHRQYRCSCAGSGRVPHSHCSRPAGLPASSGLQTEPAARCPAILARCNTLYISLRITGITYCHCVLPGIQEIDTSEASACRCAMLASLSHSVPRPACCHLLTICQRSIVTDQLLSTGTPCIGAEKSCRAVGIAGFPSQRAQVFDASSYAHSP